MNLFLALDLTPGEQEPMDDERIEIRWFSKAELGDLIRARKILDGKTIIGYFLWLEYKRRAGKPLFAR
jgi:ADP-ribose pyrophosphatase